MRMLSRSVVSVHHSSRNLALAHLSNPWHGSSYRWMKQRKDKLRIGSHVSYVPAGMEVDLETNARKTKYNFVEDKYYFAVY